MSKRVLVLGDSIALQYFPYLRDSLRPEYECFLKGDTEEALRDLDRATGSNCGDSNRILEFIDEEVRKGALNYDYLLLNCGLHDVRTDPITGRKQVDLEVYERNLRHIIGLLRCHPIHTIWIRTVQVIERLHNDGRIGFHRYRKDVGDYNAIADQLMQGNGIPVIDLCSLSESFGEEGRHDHVHFIKEVQVAQAEWIASRIIALNNFGRT